MTPEETLRSRFPALLKTAEPLALHTTFRIGGPADFFLSAADPEVFVQAVATARELGLRYFVLGGGSNILVSDEGFRGLVIKNDLCEIIRDGERVTVGSGLKLDTLVDWAAARDLAGLAFAAGIAGSVGGAVYGNAGCYGHDVGERVVEAVVLTPSGRIEVVDRAYCGFRYRHSRLKETGDLILTVTLQLEPGDGAVLDREAREHREHRALNHPTTDCSAGCFFKNIEDASAPQGKIPAGRLLEQVGAKQETRGGAAVHPGHANILINAGGATAADVLALARHLRRRVKQELGRELSREIIFLGPHGPEPERWED